MHFIKTLLILTAIPIFGASVAIWAPQDYRISDEGVNKSYFETFCSKDRLTKIPSLKYACNYPPFTKILLHVSLYSGGAALVLLLSFLYSAWYAGTDRRKIANIFPSLIFSSFLLLSMLVISQGAILVYALYLVGLNTKSSSFLIGYLGISLAAIYGFVVIMYAMLKFIKHTPEPVFGAVLFKDTNRKIYDYVDEIANTLGANPPEQIIIGLEPNFFVTCLNLKLQPENIITEKEVLFLSLPIMRILTKDELSAVIAHELGHFRGYDTHYTKRFSPVYISLMQSITAIDRDGKNDQRLGGILLYPIVTTLRYMLEIFHRNVVAISRNRELEADKAAAEVVTTLSISTSLLKISLYEGVWNRVFDSLIDDIEENSASPNLSILFSQAIKRDVDSNDIEELFNEIIKDNTTHPTDTHPSTGFRIQHLGVSPTDINADMLLSPDENSSDLVNDLLTLEEMLTEQLRQFYLSSVLKE